MGGKSYKPAYEALVKNSDAAVDRYKAQEDVLMKNNEALRAELESYKLEVKRLQTIIDMMVKIGRGSE